MITCTYYIFLLSENGYIDNLRILVCYNRDILICNRDGSFGKVRYNNCTKCLVKTFDFFSRDCCTRALMYCVIFTSIFFI